MNAINRCTVFFLNWNPKRLDVGVGRATPRIILAFLEDFSTTTAIYTVEAAEKLSRTRISQ